MGFEIEKNKVVGIVKLHTGKEGENARIKIIGFWEEGNRFKKFTESETVKYFPTDGYVFEPSFFRNDSFDDIVDGNLIEFYSTKLTKVNGPDLYRILGNNAKIIQSEEHIFELHDVILKVHEIDLTKAKITVDFNGDFYGLYQDYVIGKLRIHNGRITPAISKEVKKWDKEKCHLIEYDSNVVLISKPTDSYVLIDAMDISQLFEWFRGKLKIINKSLVDELDKRAEWREQLPVILTDSTDEVTKLNSFRLKRIESNLDNFNVLVEDIKQFTQISEKLNYSFISAIERHKNELRQEYADEIEALKNRKELEKQKLDGLLSKISVEITHKKHELSNIIEEINSNNSKIEIINANKERILSDFSIINDVLGNTTQKSEIIQTDSFVIEILPIEENAPCIDKKDKFLTRLKYCLAKNNYITSIASNLLAATATFKATFIKDEQLAIALIEATGNCKYIIQQVEPDWLHFKDLWNNGLEAIWKSSHENPDLMHFLVLEDINLSSPECYMRPLLDCMNGIRKRIPYALNEYPVNLRIFATKISSDEPKIGLPLYQQTFKNWGAVGFAENTANNPEQKHLEVEGYINSSTLLNFKLDEFDIETDLIALTSQFKNLFDRPE